VCSKTLKKRNQTTAQTSQTKRLAGKPITQSDAGRGTRPPRTSPIQTPPDTHCSATSIVHRSWLRPRTPGPWRPTPWRTPYACGLLLLVFLQGSVCHNPWATRGVADWGLAIMLMAHESWAMMATRTTGWHLSDFTAQSPCYRPDSINKDEQFCANPAVTCTP